MDFEKEIVSIIKNEKNGGGVKFINDVVISLVASNINNYTDIYEFMNIILTYVEMVDNHDIVKTEGGVQKLDINFEKLFSAINDHSFSFEYIDEETENILRLVLDENYENLYYDKNKREEFRHKIFETINDNAKK
jgi:hypothetical protein